MKNISTTKNAASIGFKKARSLLETIIKMIDEDKYCVDIMQQNLAAIGLLKKAHEQLMTNHLETCFMEAMESTSRKKKQEMIEEIKSLMRMYNR